MNLATMKQALVRSPAGRWLLVPVRAYQAVGYFSPRLARIPRWLVTSREYGNYQYDVSEDHKLYAASVVALVAAIEPQTATEYVREFDEILPDLQRHVQLLRPSSPRRHVTDDVVKPGRRLLYYALVRALRPKLVVEAGTADGLGTCVLAAAVQRNAAESAGSAVVSLDRDPTAGWLIRDRYAECVTRSVGDVCERVAGLEDASIGLYIHDTAADRKLEVAEFAAVRGKLSAGAPILSVWHTRALMELAVETRRRYVMFLSEPSDHWYPGSRLGIAFPRRP